MHRKVPIVTLKEYNRSNANLIDTQNQIQRLSIERNQLTNTVSSLFKEMHHLKEQNQAMAQEIDKLQRVLSETKSYSISLKQRHDALCSDMEFQTDLHEKVLYTLCEYAVQNTATYNNDSICSNAECGSQRLAVMDMRQMHWTKY